MNSLVGGSDFQEIIALNFDVFLTFDNVNRQLSFDVTIIDDPIFERDESFTLELRFDPFALELPSNVILSPNTTTVDVIDNEGIITINIIPISFRLNLKVCYNTMTVVIGFLNTSYSVNEGDGLVNIQIGITEGILQTSVAINFSISQNQSQTDGV